MDFGVGFYTTKILEQAKQWATIKARRENKPEGIVSVYEVTYNRDLKRKIFKNIGDSWLMFVLQHRKSETYIRTDAGLLIPNKELHHNFDIVSGEVANDQVYAAVDGYERGEFNKSELRRRLKYKTENHQEVFSTQTAVKALKYVDYIIVEGFL